MAERLDVVLVTGEYPPQVGGVGDYTRELGRALLGRGHWVSVLADVAAEPMATPADPTLLRAGPGWGWRAVQRAARMLGDLAPAIVHLQYQTGAFGMHPAIMLLPGLLRRRAPRTRVVVTAHDLRLPYLFPKADLVRSRLTAHLLNGAAAVVATNAADAARLRGGQPSDRELFSPRRPLRSPVFTIPIGSNIAVQPDVDRAAVRAERAYGADDVVVAYFGLLSRTKGVLELAEALAQLPERFKLLVVGGAAPLPDDERYAAEVHARIAALGLEHRVQLTGPLPSEQVSAHLQAADLAALPFADGASYRRGSLLAALAHGLPVITTAPQAPLEPPLRDAVEAVVLPRLEPEVIAAAITRVAADPELRSRLAEGGRQLASRFSWPAIAAEHETVYHTVLGAGA